MSEKPVRTSADDQQDVRTAEPATSDFDPEDIPESFTCCVCLDLLYKPVLLSCGHMSCFWCVHNSMSGLRESKCPICRHPYIHFPSICPMLHFLLLKLHPSTYSKREMQICEEETKTRVSSPQLDAQLWRSQRNEFLSDGNLSLLSPTNQGLDVGHSPNGDSLPSTSSILAVSKGTAHVDVDAFDYPQVLTEGPQSQDLPENELTEGQNKISIADVLCGSCKQLLFRPVALNCGHVFCKCCIPNSVPKKFECPVCQSPHPGGSPKVCLALDHFLEEKFPNDYALRKSATRPNEISSRNQSPKTGVDEAGNDTSNSSWWTDPLKTHFGVGCDYCGMCPIVGDRYQCQDCEELIGFDLCGDCYNSRCKLPGRFNQQHKPEHKFEFIRPNVMQGWMARFLTGRPPVDTAADSVLSGEHVENVQEVNNDHTMHIGYAVMEDEEEGNEQDESPSG